MDYRDRIALDPEVRFGKPTVRGTRITVGDVLSYLASGMSESDICASILRFRSRISVLVLRLLLTVSASFGALPLPDESPKLLFEALSVLRGHPPKVIWVRFGDASVAATVEFFRVRHEVIVAFAGDSEAGFLALS